jgi:hypothetical protein
VLCIKPKLMSGAWNDAPRLAYEWKIPSRFGAPPRRAILIDIAGMVNEMMTLRPMIDPTISMKKGRKKHG